MYKLICFLTLFYSCSSATDNNESCLTASKKPIVVIAKDNEGIILRDQDSIYYTFSKGTYTGGALHSTYNVGDTIK